MRSFQALGLVFILSLEGCTGINVTQVTDDSKPIQGVPWNLPMTKFTITVARSVIGCGSEVRANVEMLATPLIAVDPGQKFVLSNNGYFSTSDITSNLAPSGVSTGLNASSADATATIISNIIGTAAQSVILAASGKPGKTPPQIPSIIELCTADIAAVVAMLYPRQALQDKVKADKDALEADPDNKQLQKTLDDDQRKLDETLNLKGQLDADTAVLAAVTAKVALLTAQSVADKTYRPKLAQALSDQDLARQKLVKHQEALDDGLKKTSNVQVIIWPPDTKQMKAQGKFKLDQTVIDKWMHDVDPLTASANFSVDFAIYVSDTDSKTQKTNWKVASPAPITDISKGIPVRLAKMGRLLMWSGSEPCRAVLSPDARLKDNQTALDTVVLQLGPTYTIPVAGGTFRSESAAITLDANGLPTVIQTGEKVAGAAAFTGSLKDLATQLAALPESIRAAELAKTQAKTNETNADTALAIASATSGMQEQTGTYNAQVALINAQSALSMAQQNVGLLPLQQQVGTIQAQAAVLSAQAALVTAQANAQVVDNTSVIAAQTALINSQTALINASAALAAARISLASTP